jgi:hypothetical protein
MAKRWEAPGDLQPSATACVTGLVERQGCAVTVARQKVCRVTLQVNEGDYVVMAKGDIADQLANAKSGDAVRVSGRLVHHRWQTGECKDRSIHVIEAEEVGVVWQRIR